MFSRMYLRPQPLQEFAALEKRSNRACIASAAGSEELILFCLNAMFSQANNLDCISRAKNP
jgi:hypothetical protein